MLVIETSTATKGSDLKPKELYQFKLYNGGNILIDSWYFFEEYTFKFIENEVYVYNLKQELIFEYFGPYARLLE